MLGTATRAGIGFLAALLAACGGPGGGSNVRPAAVPGLSPADIDARERRQGALHTVSARDAYERGLTGQGVRIAVEDESLDILREEFSGRIDVDNALIAMFHPVLEGTPCPRASCVYVDADSVESVQQVAIDWVRRNGWPKDDNHVYVRVASADPRVRYHEIPALEERGENGQVIRFHGTVVASLAAGDYVGIAPRATIVPWGIPLSDPETQVAQNALANQLLSDIDEGTSTEQERIFLDETISREYAEQYSVVDIVNQSYGVGSETDYELFQEYVRQGIYFSWLKENLPRYWATVAQQDVPEEDKTLFVIATGNDGGSAPGANGSGAWFVPELRGLHLAVAALEPGEGYQPVIAGYSNRCGSLPSNWNPALDGRHFCLAAPGSGVLVYPTLDSSPVEVQGTSFAAPLVSGGLALMMEAFRGQMHPREIGLRMLNTANNKGIYSDSNIYGAGVMDLAAATSPVGRAVTGTKGRSAYLDETFAVVPSSWGDVSLRLRGAELAAFDDWNAPFWSPLSRRFRVRDDPYRPPVPDRPESREERQLTPHLSWFEGPGRPSGAGKGDAWNLRFTVGTSEEGGAPRDGRLVDAVGFSASMPGTGLRLGLVHERDANQGAGQGGAFGIGSGSAMAFLSRRHLRVLGSGGLRFEGAWTAAVGDADHEEGAMLRTTPAFYTAAEVGLVHEEADDETRLSVLQPLRAETGTGTVTYPVGRTVDGERLYASRTFALSPDAREVRLSLRRDLRLGAGRLAIEIAHAVDAGHVKGRERTSGGIGYRLAW